jgi:hypothetical protein
MRAMAESDPPATVDVPPEPAPAPRTALISKDGEIPVYAPGREPGSVGHPILTEALWKERGAIVMALRAQGYTYPEIQEATGLGLGIIRAACRKAREAGALSETLLMIENEAVPQAVDNLVAQLRKGEFGDAEMAVLKGRGVFQNYSRNKAEGGDGARLPPLQIAFISATGDALPTVIVNSPTGAVFGKPREDE